MTRPARLVAAVSVAAALVLAGCSSGAAGTNPAAATTAAAATAAAASAATAASAAASTTSGASAPAAASQPAAASAGTAGSTAGNDRCAKFTTDQVTPLTGGSPFQTAEPSVLDVPGCQWYFSSGVGNVNLQILPAAQYGDWSGKPGVTSVSGVGDTAFVGPYVLGGTMAGAQVGGTFYFLTVSPAPSNDAVVAFLKQAIAQAGGS